MNSVRGSSDVFKAIVADNYCSASPGRELAWLGRSVGRPAGRPAARPAERPSQADSRPGEAEQ